MRTIYTIKHRHLSMEFICGALRRWKVWIAFVTIPNYICNSCIWMVAMQRPYTIYCLENWNLWPLFELRIVTSQSMFAYLRFNCWSNTNLNYRSTTDDSFRLCIVKIWTNVLIHVLKLNIKICIGFQMDLWTPWRVWICWIGLFRHWYWSVSIANIPNRGNKLLWVRFFIYHFKCICISIMLINI